ncbi:MAG: hypothetical protein ACK4UN_12135, partial [Limisphaerales bacterium]
MHSSAETVEARNRKATPSGDKAQRSELLELCFPASAPAQDEIRRLAYANTICLLFIVLAIVGIKTPVFVIGPSKPPEDIVPVVFEPPPQAEQQLASEPQYAPDLVEPNYEPVQEMPQVVPVLAADASQVTFAIPVEGPVILTPARYAAPPPRVLPPPAAPANPGPPRPVEFRAGTQDGGI